MDYIGWRRRNHYMYVEAIKHRLTPARWTTQDGVSREIRELSNDHVGNILKHLGSNLQSLKWQEKKDRMWIAMLKQELKIRKSKGINIPEYE